MGARQMSQHGGMAAGQHNQNPVQIYEIPGLWTEKGMDYWLVANSWSPAWGEKGYFKIRRGTNECGIETIPAAGIVF
jgi:hypothetical protein